MKMARSFCFSLSLAALMAGAAPLAFADQSHSAGRVTLPAPGEKRFQSVGHAWAVLQHGVEQVEKALEQDALGAIHGVEGRIASALLWWQAYPGEVAAEKKARLEAALRQALALSANLHEASDRGDKAKVESELKKLKGALKLISVQYAPEQLVAPEGIVLDAPLEPTLRITAEPAKPLKVGEPVEVTVKLTRPDGSPVLLEDLVEAHTEKIHLLIIDSSLTDYHHEHPKPGRAPGEYVFRFTPRKPGSYRVWADVIPAETGAQEYVIADILAETQGEPLTDREPRLVGESGGLRYELSFDKPEIRAGEAVLGTLRITRPDGSVFDQLEPLMGAYAHLVGFSEDYHSIAHVHPMGKEPERPEERGYGELRFHLMPSQPGLMRLFAQVQINGKDVFIPYTLDIREAKPAVAKSAGAVPVLDPAVLKQALEAYAAIQTALAGDTLEGVAAACDALTARLKDDAVVQRETAAIQKAASIDEARQAFRPLSEHVIALLQAQPEKKGYYLANCPMANGSWVQLEPSLRNPYYGASMLRCGTIRAVK